MIEYASNTKPVDHYTPLSRYLLSDLQKSDFGLVDGAKVVDPKIRWDVLDGSHSKAKLTANPRFATAWTWTQRFVRALVILIVLLAILVGNDILSITSYPHLAVARSVSAASCGTSTSKCTCTGFQTKGNEMEPVTLALLDWVTKSKNDAPKTCISQLCYGVRQCKKT